MPFFMEIKTILYVGDVPYAWVCVVGFVHVSARQITEQLTSWHHSVMKDARNYSLTRLMRFLQLTDAFVADTDRSANDRPHH